MTMKMTMTMKRLNMHSLCVGHFNWTPCQDLNEEVRTKKSLMKLNKSFVHRKQGMDDLVINLIMYPLYPVSI